MASKETSLLLLLDALRHLTSARDAETDQWHSTITRLQFLVSSNEESRKEITLKKNGGIELLLSSLELCSGDLSVMLGITRLLSDLASRVKGLTALSRRGAVGVLMRVLAWTYKTYPSEDRLLNSFIHLLVTLASKEKQFALKARLCGVLPIPLALIKRGLHRGALFSALQLMKQCSTKGVNCTVLGKKGAVTVLYKLLKDSTKADTRFQRTILDALVAVTSHKDNAVKFVSIGGIRQAMELFSDYCHDRDSRHVALCKDLLQLMKNCTVAGVGKEAFLSCDGMRILYDVCTIPQSAKLLKPSQLRTVLFLLRRCQPKFPLPIDKTAHPITFKISEPTLLEDDDDDEEENDHRVDTIGPIEVTSTWHTPINLSHFSKFFPELFKEEDDEESEDSESPLNFASSKCYYKIPAPQKHGHNPREGLVALKKKCSVLAEKNLLIKDVERYIRPDVVINRVVFDLEDSCRVQTPLLADKTTLQFDSRFECGNLRRAIQIRSNEYDLILSSDINSDRHHQWFYFEVSNFACDVPYRFNIINCEKPNSQFNYGMQPVLYSTQNGPPSWIRRGTNVCYFRNNYLRHYEPKQTTYYTLTFTIVFPLREETCYIAYHFPYSYTTLKDHLRHLQKLGAAASEEILFRRQTLCSTLSGNSCDVLTITAQGDITGREYVFLTSRVHPGESNSSWSMEGILDFLLSGQAEATTALQKFVFKIIPMLNPDGVINGSHRCSLLGRDLNRLWLNPDCTLQPTIYHAKALLQYLVAIERVPLVFCDLHGHSRRKNVFLFGCRQENPNEDEEEKGNEEMHLPSILSHLAPLFSYKGCSFSVEKSKEGTGRVVVWRQLGIIRSYTMEHTYCGADQGQYKGYQVDTNQLKEMGQRFCTALIHLVDQTNASLFKEKGEENDEDKGEDEEKSASTTRSLPYICLSGLLGFQVWITVTQVKTAQTTTKKTKKPNKKRCLIRAYRSRVCDPVWP